MAHTVACLPTRPNPALEPKCNSRLEAPSALTCTEQAAVAFGSTPTLGVRKLRGILAPHYKSN